MDSEGKVPIRLIDVQDETESFCSKIFTNKLDGPRRVDPHPVWTQESRKICFNGVVDGMRQVMISDFSEHL